MRNLIVPIIMCLGLSACGATVQTVSNEWYHTNINPTGFTNYDPPNGDWMFIRNEPNAASRQSRKMQGWYEGSPIAPRY
jgi:hypothetical protein